LLAPRPPRSDSTTPLTSPHTAQALVKPARDHTSSVCSTAHLHQQSNRPRTYTVDTQRSKSPLLPQCCPPCVRALGTFTHLVSSHAPSSPSLPRPSASDPSRRAPSLDDARRPSPSEWGRPRQARSSFLDMRGVGGGRGVGSRFYAATASPSSASSLSFHMPFSLMSSMSSSQASSLGIARRTTSLPT